MLNYASWLKYVKAGIERGDVRYTVIDDEHILDTSSGAKIHMYDDWFKITHDDEVVATMRDFNQDTEQPIVWEIKKLITSTEKTQDEELNYMKYVMERRENLADILQNPTPLGSIETGDEEYTG